MSEATDIQTALQQVRRLSDTIDENSEESGDFGDLRRFLEDVEDALIVAAE